MTTEDTVKKAGKPHLYNYPCQFANNVICPVAPPIVVSKFFGYVNYVYYKNKPRQSDLAFEKYRVTQCGWIRLCMAVVMGMAIKIF